MFGAQETWESLCCRVFVVIGGAEAGCCVVKPHSPQTLEKDELVDARAWFMDDVSMVQA